jgi:hypothetical protein
MLRRRLPLEPCFMFTVRSHNMRRPLLTLVDALGPRRRTTSSPLSTRLAVLVRLPLLLGASGMGSVCETLAL